MADVERMNEGFYRQDRKMEPEEFGYYSEVVRRLEQAVGAWLPLEDCLALTLVLEQHVFAYEDGFVIGEGEYGDDLGYGTKTAADLARCFLDPRKYNLRRYDLVRIWQCAHFPEHALDMVNRKERLVRLIVSSLGVRRKAAE
jgi:hypothetical protein